MIPTAIYYSDNALDKSVLRMKISPLRKPIKINVYSFTIGFVIIFLFDKKIDLLVI